MSIPSLSSAAQDAFKEHLERERRRFRFELSGTPPNWLNARLHHMALHRAKRQWSEATRVAIMGAGARGYPRAVEGERRIVSFELHRSTFIDPDALAGSCKPILDALQAHAFVRGPGNHMLRVPGPALIWSDDEAHVDPRYTQVKARRDAELTVVTVEWGVEK